jgi:predicted Rossmann-fold nucleotide-binding protein
LEFCLSLEVGAWSFIIPKMERIAVSCGSNMGARPAYTEAAERLGELLARKKSNWSMAGAWWD